MAVALVPVPQCFYWLRLLPYLWQFSGCDTMRFYSPRPSCSNHLLCLLPSLAALERLMRLTSLCLLPSSWHSSAGFPYFFAAIARGPLAFATRWIWAADIAESIETAAVRAPLCLRFPLLLGSVQAGVGLLSPPPTRRCGCCLFVAFLAMVGAVRGFPPLPPIPCRRLPFGILPFSCALGCPIGRGPQSHPVVASGDGGSCSGIPLSPRPGR